LITFLILSLDDTDERQRRFRLDYKQNDPGCVRRAAPGPPENTSLRVSGARCKPITFGAVMQFVFAQLSMIA